MEAISLLLQASQAQENNDYVIDYAARVGAKPLVSPINTDIEAVDAILHLRGDSFDSTAAARWHDNFNGYSPSDHYSEELNFGRRRRAMSEPWMTMSSPNLSNTPHGELSSPSKRPVPFHPALLQPRFPQPLMALLPSQPHTPGLPHRMPTIDEFASICNKNGRIGVYTKEEREVLIRRFREKKKRRIWKKKIRYECRKDLADRRTRVKGRFVKAAISAAVPATNSNNAFSNNVKPPRRSKKAGIILTMQEASGSLSSSDNTSEETNFSVEYQNNDKMKKLQPPLAFHFPAKKGSKSMGISHKDKTIEVKPLHLEQFDNAEDRLKYLARILGGEMSDSISPGDDDEDDEDEEEDDEEEEEEDLGQVEGEGNKEAMNVVSSEPSQRRASLRKRSGSEMDYRRPRRHSIAY